MRVGLRLPGGFCDDLEFGRGIELALAACDGLAENFAQPAAGLLRYVEGVALFETLLDAGAVCARDVHQPD
jgi:hypothetical protein